MTPRIEHSDEADLDRRVGESRAVRDGFDDLPVPTVVLHGPQLRVVAANAAHRRFTGREHPVGATVREAFPELEGQRLFEIVEQAYRTGEEVTAHEWRTPSDADGSTWESYRDFVLTPQKDAEGQVTGVVLQQIDVTDRVLERRRAESATAAAERRYDEAHETVVELQKALLPPSLPVLPAVRTAARYLVADRERATGGDWFDAIPLGGGRLALVVGDIVGRGVAASAAMGRLRAILGEFITRSSDLREAVQRADEFASISSDMRASTLCAAVLDVREGRIDYSTCGHPAPLLVGADASSRQLAPSGGTPLGTGGPVRSASAPIAPGETLLLFSDGLIERAGHTLDEGLGAVEEVIRDAVRDTALPTGSPSSPAERICQLAVELLSRTGYDDITTLAAHVLASPQLPVRVVVPATVDGLLEARGRLSEWVRPLDLSPEELQGLDLAITETLTNAIEHAYPEQGIATVRVDAALGEDGVLEVSVIDEGTWDERTQPSVTSGRGLWIAESATDRLRIAHRGRPGDPGSRVVMRRALRHPPHLTMPQGRTPSPPGDDHDGLEITEDERDPSRLVLRGSADISCTEHLTEQLGRSGRGGFRDLTVDLSGLQLLASSAVRVLLDLRARHDAHGHELCLIASSGTPAQSVLDVVGLPWSEPHIHDGPPRDPGSTAPAS
ncbi:SpoIIE family protein phosphatase [Brachybacterium sp. ACRRE]|uniref:SpoIIE family protein phosphatase n=1 Tax=Brachybacterium sp. ACRRE TaxID=2918184 RepID=UPI001EF233E1|nr:SpoIIE family protein phosphatase [Brachybacterium sp. ACRRE]MCG7309606.1 SpoIIE family protein phosphatase [Brachybacterium sp. ACRRE]